MDASVGCTSGQKVYLWRSVFEFLEIQADVVWHTRIHPVATNAMVCICLTPIGGLIRGDLGNMGKPNMDTIGEGDRRLAVDRFVCRGCCAGAHVDLDVLCVGREHG